MKKALLLFAALLVAGCVAFTGLAADAALISITADDEHINWTNDGGSASIAPEAGEGFDRDEDNLVDFSGISGAPQVHAEFVSNASDHSSNLGTNPSPEGGLLIDLGAVYNLSAMQIWNFNLGGAVLAVTEFDLLVATDPAAVTLLDGEIVVADLGLFATVTTGTVMPLEDGGADYLGETFLFGGGPAPASVGDQSGAVDTLSGSPLTARYVFLDNLATAQIVGLSEIQFFGTPLRFAITEIDYAPDAAPNPTVTLTWRKSGAAAYIAKYSTDMIDWGADMGGRLTDAIDENPGDPDQITETFDLSDFGLENESDLFFRIEEAPPVGIFEEHFDGANAGTLPTDWTTGFDPADTLMNTNWDLGDPSGTGPLTAFSGAHCVGTNLLANYGLSSNTWLRTPAIDLSTASGATLTFQQWIDMDEFNDLDRGTVRVLDAATLVELAVVEAVITGLGALDWDEFSADLPAEALGKIVLLEFQFVSDGDDVFDASGWYIDDVAVTTPAP
jgi:hypothetical protein